MIACDARALLAAAWHLAAWNPSQPQLAIRHCLLPSPSLLVIREKASSVSAGGARFIINLWKPTLNWATFWPTPSRMG